MNLKSLAISVLTLISISIDNYNQDIKRSMSTADQSLTKLIDPRDLETYDVVVIGDDTWMGQNLRYNIEGSIVNPDNPNQKYGRLYTITAAQEACPSGWHIATDREWNTLEIAHGMPAIDSLNNGWRGEHAPFMRATADWASTDVVSNTLGFNILPAGYYFNETVPEWEGFEGLGYSAAFWSSTIDGVGYARFMFDEKKFINKWPDTNNDSGASLSCRCVKDRKVRQ